MKKKDIKIHTLVNPDAELEGTDRERFHFYLLKHRHNLEQTVKSLKYAAQQPNGDWAVATLPYYSHALGYVKHMQAILRQKKTRRLLSDFQG